MPLFGPPDIQKLQGKRDVSGLIGALGHKDAAIRVDAAIALRELKDSRAVMPVVAPLGDQNEFVREAAADALGVWIWVNREEHPANW